MKILFLCGALEPGRDGVGDYTRRIAGELIRQNHQAAIVALNDESLYDEFNGTQDTDGISLSVLRLPSIWLPSKRFKKAASWIEEFNPEWISLQFVPFAFHPKGLSIELGNLLLTLGKGKHWHIMVHELWVGMDKESKLKFVLWGWLQRQLIKLLILQLKPALIHTQAGLYMEILKKRGYNPLHLPLFGNIAVLSGIKNKENIHLNGRQESGSSTISFVVFGGIHPGAPIGTLAKELKKYSDANGITVVLKMIGRSGNEQSRWEQEWQAAGLTVEALGEQQPEVISTILSTSTFGISTTPPALTEKSGSVAAMREHGLNILCISRTWNPRGIRDLRLPPGVVAYKQGIIADFIASNTKTLRADNNITDITYLFVKNLLASV